MITFTFNGAVALGAKEKKLLGSTESFVLVPVVSPQSTIDLKARQQSNNNKKVDVFYADSALLLFSYVLRVMKAANPS